MTTIVIPGRHLITSAFMVEYLEQILANGLESVPLVGNWTHEDKVARVVVPITSANQHGSRYNPVPLYARVIGLERTLAPFRERYGIQITYVPIPHFHTIDNFAAHTLKYVHTHIADELSPENALIWTSTKGLIDAYVDLGYTVLPAEWDGAKAAYRHDTPNVILETLAEAGDQYQSQPAFQLLSDATQTLWKDMPEIPEHIFRLWNDPILTEEGSLTGERDYSTYSSAMSHSDIMDAKFSDIRSAVVEGKIVDEGCADGALMVRLAETFRDSDIIGIDITGEFVSRVEERQRAGEFGASFVHVYQRNLLQPIFAPNSINSVICNSTLHELWSYGSQASSVVQYLEEKYRQLLPGGRLIIRDVVGPEDKEEIIYLKLNDDDGQNIDPEDIEALLQAETASLSTQTLFYRFTHDFLRELRESGRRDVETKIQFETETIDGELYFKLRRKDAVEFLSRKDYHDNWDSEMNEEFAFWDFSEWTDALTKAKFKIVHEAAAEPKFSKAYCNDWIVENRWRSCAMFYTKNNSGALVELPYPVTNMVLVGEKIDL